MDYDEGIQYRHTDPTYGHGLDIAHTPLPGVVPMFCDVCGSRIEYIGEVDEECDVCGLMLSECSKAGEPDYVDCE